jgi:hypothetical protein
MFKPNKEVLKCFSDADISGNWRIDSAEKTLRLQDREQDMLSNMEVASLYGHSVVLYGKRVHCSVAVTEGSNTINRTNKRVAMRGI